MLSSSVSSFWSKFKIYFPEEDSSVFESLCSLSELDGYQVVNAKFAIYPSRDNNFFTRPHRSCFNLLSRLIQKDNDGSSLSKADFIAKLLNNAELIESLKSSYNSELMSNYNAHAFKIVFSVENDPILYQIPTHDFACVRHHDSVLICTALDDNPADQFTYLKIRNFSPELESALKDFMVNPLNSTNVSNEFQRLPIMDMSNVVVHSQGNFENYIDDTQGSSNDYNSPSLHTSLSENSKSLNKTSTSSPSRPAKKNDSAKTYSNPSSRQCLNCFCTSTPMWRRGPDGTASLCNACGVKFKSGKLQMSAELVDANLKKIRQSQITTSSQEVANDKENFENTIIENDQNNNYDNQLESNLVLHQY